MSATDENKSSVQINFDSDKLEAVAFYLKHKQGTTIEKELSEALDGIYKKCVPVQVREYIERKNTPSPEKASVTQN